MRSSILTVLLIAALVFAAAGLEGLAKGPNSSQQLKVKSDQNQMNRYTLQNQVQVLKSEQNIKAQKGRTSGPADGSGNKGNRPQDGTGYGSNSGKKAGPQDGTGPRCGSGGQGKGRRGGRN